VRRGDRTSVGEPSVDPIRRSQEPIAEAQPRANVAPRPSRGRLASLATRTPEVVEKGDRRARRGLGDQIDARLVKRDPSARECKPPRSTHAICMGPEPGRRVTRSGPINLAGV
jgi:hypothetical protein